MSFVLLVFTVQKHPKARLNEQQGSSCLSASADSVFLLSLMSDRSGLGPGKYTDQLQSTACSNCPIGSYADTWLGRIFTQTSLQLFTHFCTFANTKNLLDSDFSANPKGFRLWDCFVARGQAYRNATLVLQAVRPFLRQGTKDFELFALHLDTESIGTW